MLEPDKVLQFRLTLLGSFPEIWRRILVPDTFTLESFHFVISYSFGWLEDCAHEFSQGSRTFGPRDKYAPEEREYEHRVFLTSVFRYPWHDMQYVFSFRDEWHVDVEFELEQAPVPHGRYPCCIDGEIGGPPDGVGGLTPYCDILEAPDRPAAWKALVTKSPRSRRLDAFSRPWELDIGEINRALELRFHPPQRAFA